MSCSVLAAIKWVEYSNKSCTDLCRIFSLNVRICFHQTEITLAQMLLTSSRYSCSHAALRLRQCMNNEQQELNTFATSASMFIFGWFYLTFSGLFHWFIIESYYFFFSFWTNICVPVSQDQWHRTTSLKGGGTWHYISTLYLLLPPPPPPSLNACNCLMT